MNVNAPLQFFGQFGFVYVLAMAISSFLLHLFLTIGVYNECSERSIRGRKVWFIGPFFWAFATFFGGIVTAAIYWVLHHSTLSPLEEQDSDEV